MRCISRIASDLHTGSLREQIWDFSTLLRLDIGIYVAGSELSSIFDPIDSWATGMIANDNIALLGPSRVGPGIPNSVDPGLGYEPIHLWLGRQSLANQP
jgi:hypothetical protein